MSGELKVGIWLTIIIALLFWCFLKGIEYTNDKNKKSNTATIDGCEYIENATYYGYKTYTHKGSCTNCWARMEKLINKDRLEKE